MIDIISFFIGVGISMFVLLLDYLLELYIDKRAFRKAIEKDPEFISKLTKLADKITELIENEKIEL